MIIFIKTIYNYIEKYNMNLHILNIVYSMIISYDP